MHDVVFVIAMLWLLALVGMLIAHAVRTRRLVDRVLALDSVVLVFVAALAVVGIEQGEPGYFDVAVVLAMLGFVQTVATVRLVERRKDLS
jgi:multisubunit Na+/H+ antiporter MnhF subunit